MTEGGEEHVVPSGVAKQAYRSQQGTIRGNREGGVAVSLWLVIKMNNCKDAAVSIISGLDRKYLLRVSVITSTITITD